jgi:hypothetical protein
MPRIQRIATVRSVEQKRRTRVQISHFGFVLSLLAVFGMLQLGGLASVSSASAPDASFADESGFAPVGGGI